MHYLQYLNHDDWQDISPLRPEEALQACAERPALIADPLRIVRRRELKDGREDTILKEWPPLSTKRQQ